MITKVIVIYHILGIEVELSIREHDQRSTLRNRESSSPSLTNYEET